MTEPALNLVETEPVEEKALTIVDQARAVKVFDNQTYNYAGVLWKSIGDMIKEVKETFDPICAAAHKAHTAATEKRDKFLGPLTIAQKAVKKLMSDYDATQEKIRQAEQRRLEEIARKAAEEQALLDAIAAEEEAKRNGATKEEAKQEAEAIISQPVYVPPVVIPKTTPKLAGGPVYRTIWKFKIVNEKLLPREMLTPDLVKLGQLARALKGQFNVPGAVAYEERC